MGAQVRSALPELFEPKSQPFAIDASCELKSSLKRMPGNKVVVAVGVGSLVGVLVAVDVGVGVSVGASVGYRVAVGVIVGVGVGVCNRASIGID